MTAWCLFDPDATAFLLNPGLVTDAERQLTRWWESCRGTTTLAELRLYTSSMSGMTSICAWDWLALMV